MKKKLAVLSIACLLGLGLSVAQADTQAMADKCDSCHGKDGNSEDGKVPNIAGLSEAYVSDTLSAYAAGDRKGLKYQPKDGDESDMNTIAKKLGEADVMALAKHYAGKTFMVHAQTVDAGSAANGQKLFDKYCEKCHSEGGSVADDDAGVLLGQWKPYLEEQFKMFTSGDREMPKKMKKRFKKLDDAGKAQVIDFLASGKK